MSGDEKMGITTSSLNVILHAKELGVDFRQTLTIGRQMCYMRQDQVDDILNGYDPSFTPEEAASLKKKLDESRQTKTEEPFFEPLLANLGAEMVDSMDYSDYQNATIIQDLNTPVPPNLKNRFSFVLDSGTLEHIFNFPVAIKNCMDMVRVGGHLMLITPGNNYFGHGFYQFSPELFFSLLSEENGYAETRVFMQDDRLRWYEVSSPKQIRKRVDVCCAKSTPAIINVISRKVGDVPDELIVQQSDYVEIWSRGKENPISASQPPASLRLLGLYRKIPKNIRLVTTPFLRRILVRRIGMREFYTPCGDFDRPRKKRD